MAKETNSANGNDFASLFERSLSGMERLKPGQIVDTRIVSIAGDTVFLELSGKSEGVLDSAELTDKDGNLTVHEGDSIKVFFLESRHGEMRFTTRLSGEKAAPSMLESAFANKIPVEGLVEKEIKGGYEVMIGEIRAFCPHSQMGLRRSEDASAFVGKRLTFRIQEYKDNGRRVIVSSRAILEEARLAKIEELKQVLHEGMIVKGTITSLQSFGAFVDLGGVQALLPASEIGLERIDDVSAVLSEGQEIEAKILRIDWNSERISLSTKALLADPWLSAREKYPLDSRHAGKVARIADFGAFITLEPGLDGLVHVSELRGDDKYGNPRKPLTIGQDLSVVILDVDAAKRRISLRPASSVEDDAATSKYLESDGGSDTYNPFAALLKKK